MTMLTKVPYIDLVAQHDTIKDRLLSAVDEVLSTGQFILGPQVEVFEKRFAELCGVKHAIGVNSGTDALIMALCALDIGPGDEVITPANSYITTTSSIILVGATPVFVDVKDDYTIDPELIEKAVTQNTKAILPVHPTGKPADMTAIRAIAQKHRLKIVEDCAQAVSAEHAGQKVGSSGDVGCFSLHPLKTLSACGDAGIVTTNDDVVYEQIMMLRNNGFIDRNTCQVWSNNSRLDSLQAAMLNVKFDYLEEWTEKRIGNARFYDKQFSAMDYVQTPIYRENERSIYHTYVIRVDERKELQKFLKEKGIGTKVHYPIPIHLQPAAKELGYNQGDLPKTEKQAKTVLSLPVHPELTEDQLVYVVEMIKEYFETKG